MKDPKKTMRITILALLLLSIFSATGLVSIVLPQPPSTFLVYRDSNEGDLTLNQDNQIVNRGGGGNGTAITGAAIGVRMRNSVRFILYFLVVMAVAVFAVLLAYVLHFRDRILRY